MKTKMILKTKSQQALGGEGKGAVPFWVTFFGHQRAGANKIVDCLEKIMGQRVGPIFRSKF